MNLLPPTMIARMQALWGQLDPATGQPYSPRAIVRLIAQEFGRTLSINTLKGHAAKAGWARAVVAPAPPPPGPAVKQPLRVVPPLAADPFAESPPPPKPPKRDIVLSFDDRTYKLWGIGCSDKDVALVHGVSEDVLAAGLKAYPEIAARVAKAKVEAKQSVLVALFKKATGFDAVEDYTNGNGHSWHKVRKEAPDMRAIQFWLCNRWHDEWRGQDRLELATSQTAADKSLLEGVDPEEAAQRLERAAAALRAQAAAQAALPSPPDEPVH
jgi:hypothetical protein